jgi:hypothetical protein
MILAAEAGTSTFGFSFESPNNIPEPQVDPMTNVYIGEPWYPDETGIKRLVIPFKPHVFIADITLSGEVGPRNTAKDMCVLFSHGGDHNGQWLMQDLNSVSEVVELYNGVHTEQPIALAAVCNPTAVKIPRVIHPLEATIGGSAIRELSGRTTLTITTEIPLEQAFHWPEGMAKKFRLGKRVTEFERSQF